MEPVGIVEVSGPDGTTRSLHVGERLVFGRDPEADLLIGGDPWLSRRAGEISVLTDGVRVSNLSTKHGLHIQLSEDLLRLPPVVEEPSVGAGCFLVSGVALVGSGAMLKQQRMVRVVLPEQWESEELQDDPPERVVTGKSREGTTERPIRLPPQTKDFMVAFVLCRPWLEDPTRMARLPTVPQIVEAALTITESHHLLDQLAADQQLRERLCWQVQDHLRTLRKRLQRRGLVDSLTELTPPVIVATLLHYDVIGPRHLALLNNREWLTLQENKWWGEQ